MEKTFPRKAYAWLYLLWLSAMNQLYVARFTHHPDAPRKRTAVTQYLYLSGFRSIERYGGSATSVAKHNVSEQAGKRVVAFALSLALTGVPECGSNPAKRKSHHRRHSPSRCTNCIC